MDVKKFFKKVGVIILAAVSGFLACLFGRKCLRSNRDGANDVRNNLGTAEASNRDARKTVININDTTESIRQSTNNIKQSNRECSEIISNIRSRGPKKKS